MTEKNAVDYLTGFVVMTKALVEIENAKLEEVIGTGDEDSEEEFVIEGTIDTEILVEALDILLMKLKSNDMLLASIFDKEGETEA
jgi:hypothetical protein